MREYGGSASDPTIVIFPFGSALRSVSAAITPAGPLPRIKYFIIHPRCLLPVYDQKPPNVCLGGFYLLRRGDAKLIPKAA